MRSTGSVLVTQRHMARVTAWEDQPDLETPSEVSASAARHGGALPLSPQLSDASRLAADPEGRQHPRRSRDQQRAATQSRQVAKPAASGPDSLADAAAATSAQQPNGNGAAAISPFAAGNVAAAKSAREGGADGAAEQQPAGGWPTPSQTPAAAVAAAGTKIEWHESLARASEDSGVSTSSVGPVPPAGARDLEKSGHSLHGEKAARRQVWEFHRFTNLSPRSHKPFHTMSPACLQSDTHVLHQTHCIASVALWESMAVASGRRQCCGILMAGHSCCCFANHASQALSFEPPVSCQKPADYTFHTDTGCFRVQATMELLFFASVGDPERCRVICETWDISVADRSCCDYDRRTPL